MTTIQAQLVGASALLPRADLERLVEIARRNESIDLRFNEDDLPTLGLMRLAERGGAFEFWHDAGEDVYTTNDGESL